MNLSDYDISTLASCVHYFPELGNLSGDIQTLATTYLDDCDNILRVGDDLFKVLDAILVIVICVGLLLNGFVLSVLLTEKTKTPTDIYLTSIAVGDVMICLATAISTQAPPTTPFILTGEVFQNAGMFLSVTTIMVFTIERYLAVKDPMASLSVCTKENSVRVCLGTWAVLLVYCVAGQFFVHNYSQSGELTDSRRSFIFFYVNFVLFYVLPLVVSLTLYGLILRIINQRAANFARCAYSQVKPKPAPAARHSPVASVRTSHGMHDNERSNLAIPLVRLDHSDDDSSPSSALARTLSVPRGNTRRRNTDANPDEKLQKFKNLKKMINLFVFVLVSFVLLMSPYRWIVCVRGILYAANLPTTGYTALALQVATVAASIIYVSNSIVDPILYNILTTRFRVKLSKRFGRHLDCLTSRDRGDGGGRGMPVMTQSRASGTSLASFNHDSPAAAAIVLQSSTQPPGYKTCSPAGTFHTPAAAAGGFPSRLARTQSLGPPRKL